MPLLYESAIEWKRKNNCESTRQSESKSESMAMTKKNK